MTLHAMVFLLLCFLIPANKTIVKSLPAMFIDLTASSFQDTPPAPAHEPVITRQPKERESAPKPALIGQKTAQAEPSAKSTDPDNSDQASDISRAFANASRMQAMVMRTRHYFDFTAMAIKNMVEGILPVDERQIFEGGAATVTATYKAGDVVDLSVAADNPELRGVLKDNVDWESIPPPEKFMLTYNKVSFHIFLKNGRAVISISPQ